MLLYRLKCLLGKSQARSQASFGYPAFYKQASITEGHLLPLLGPFFVNIKQTYGVSQFNSTSDIPRFAPLPSIYGISKTIAPEAFIWQYNSTPYYLRSSGDWLSFVALIFTFERWASHSSAWYLFSLRLLQCVKHYEQWRYLHVNTILCKLYALLLKDINYFFILL